MADPVQILQAILEPQSEHDTMDAALRELMVGTIMESGLPELTGQSEKEYREHLESLDTNMMQVLFNLVSSPIYLEARKRMIGR